MSEALRTTGFDQHQDRIIHGASDYSFRREMDMFFFSPHLFTRPLCQLLSRLGMVEDSHPHSG